MSEIFFHLAVTMTTRNSGVTSLKLLSKGKGIFHVSSVKKKKKQLKHLIDLDWVKYLPLDKFLA